MVNKSQINQAQINMVSHLVFQAQGNDSLFQGTSDKVKFQCNEVIAFGRLFTGLRFVFFASFLSALGLPFSLGVSHTCFVHLGFSLQDIP